MLLFNGTFPSTSCLSELETTYRFCKVQSFRIRTIRIIFVHYYCNRTVNRTKQQSISFNTI